MTNAKVVIEFDGVKRELAVPFAICADRKTIEYIIRELQDHLDDHAWVYGWTRIRAPYQDSSAPGAAPLPWHSSSTVGAPHSEG